MIGAIILGIVAGYVGRLLMPGRDKMGFIATMLLGLAGAVVGFLIFTELLGIGDDRMFDLGGLIGAVLGVMLLLVLYRLALKNKEHPLARYPDMEPRARSLRLRIALGALAALRAVLIPGQAELLVGTPTPRQRAGSESATAAIRLSIGRLGHSS